MSALARLRPRDRRALRWGLVLLLPLVVARLVVVPYVHALRDLRERAEAERGLLRRELALLDETTRYPALLHDAEARAGAEVPRLFRGPDELSAAAALSYYASEQARRSRVLVQQIDSRNPTAAGGGLQRLEVELRAQGDLQGMLAWLASLERGPHLVRVERISVERPGASATPDQSETLDATLTLVGYGVVAKPKDDAAPARPIADGRSE